MSYRDHDKETSYLVEGCSLHLVKHVMKRLYSEKSMTSDDMRDCAHKLEHFLTHELIETKEGESP